MKKVFLMVAAVAAALGMNAKTVSPAKALSEAREFCHASELKGVLHSAGPAANMQVVYTHPEGGYYVVSRGAGAGYVIVAGDDCSPLILGYTTSGDFNYSEMPEPAREWLEGYAKQVAVSAEAGVAYQESEGSDHAKITPLLTTTWNQSAPYSDLCPKTGLKEDSKNHCPTGCVATAMAQVLNYHKWPEKAQGSGVAYYLKGQYDVNPTKLDAIDMSNDTFEWDKMLNSYTVDPNAEGAGTAEQRAAVALLMRDCGYSAEMAYADASSGTSDINIPAGLINNFGYDKAMHLVKHDWYTDEEWDNVVYTELSTNGPVLYSGVTAKSEGHEFVCDGYNGDGYYHFNWGWAGISDGYFKLSALNPKIQGTGGSSSTLAFNYRQGVVVGFKKPVEGSQNKVLIVQTSSMLPDASTAGKISCDLTNYSTVKFVGELGFKVTNESTKEISYSSCGNVNLNIAGVVRSLNDNLTLADGTYRLRTVFKQEGGEWTECQCCLGKVNELVVTVKDGKKTYSSDIEFAYTGTSVNDMILVENGKSNFQMTLSGNGGTHTADIWFSVEDTTTKDIMFKSTHATFNFDVNSVSKSFSCTMDAVKGYDKSHSFAVAIWDGETKIGEVDTLEAVDEPKFEVIEALAFSNATDGKIEDGVTPYVKMKMKNVNKVAFKDIKVQCESYDLEDQDSNNSSSYELRVQDLSWVKIEDDIITFDGEAEDFDGEFYAAGPGYRLTFVFSYVLNKSNIYYYGTKEQSTVVVDVVDKSGIDEVGADGATVEKSEVYNLQGMRVASFAGKAEVKTLPEGLYIVRSHKSDGTTSAAKQLVK